MEPATSLTDDDTATILVVDDHDENILALEGMLARPGIRVLTARSGVEALRLILKHEFAVILLDVLMPTMDGFDTARLIRTRDASKHTPIIFLTAAGSDIDMVHQGYAVGAVDYLVKPLNADFVKAKVAVFVDLFRKARQIRRQEGALRFAERERADAALKESDALYEASFNAAAVGIAHADADGRWVRVNPRFCQIIGYSSEETLQLRFQDVTHPDDVAEEVAGFGQLVAGQISAYHREKRYLHRDGHVVWVELTVSLLHDAAGKPKHFVKVVEDVTERKRAEERQRLLTSASQILLRSLDHHTTIEDVARLVVTSLCDWCVIATVNSNDEPGTHISIAHSDPELGAVAHMFSKRLSTNPRFCQRLGNDLTDVSADLSNLAADSWNLDNATWELLQSLGCGSSIIVPLTVRQQVLGQIILVLANPARRFGPRDLATAQDLAQRIALGVENARLYREAQDAIRARDEFLSIASHELRTPLTPLQIHFQRLLGKPRDKVPTAPDQLQRVLVRCERQVRRLEALIDNLLDVSRISSGRLRLQPEQVDLGDIVREVSGRFAEELAAAGCRLLLQNDAPVVGSWDRLRLEQVVTNVLGNAIKYGNGNPIEIAIESTPEGGRLTIADHGIGIEGAHLSRIFRRFQRAVPSRSYGGLGLGLYIAQQIVDAHRGTIRVESTPGTGSIFVVELPRESPDQDRSGSGPHQGTEASHEYRAHLSS